MILRLALLGAYTALLVGLGLWLGRRVTSTRSFFVAERSLGPGLLGATVLAANIGAGSTVGAAGLAYRDGAAAWWWVGSAALGTLLLGVWIGPRIWRLAREHDLRTLGDYLELRYGPAVRGIVAAFLWLGTLAILAGQLIAIAWVLEAVAAIPKPVGCLLGGLAMTVYFTAGGLLSSAWVNLVQLGVIVVGFLLALPLALAAAGGGAALTRLGESEGWNALSGEASGWHLAILLVPAFLVSPGLIQKVYGARDERAVRLGVVASALALFGFAFLPTVLGMCARVLHPDLAQPEMALPTLLVADLPLAIGLLGLAAVFSAEVSSADAILFMLSTSLSQDLYRRFLAPGADDRRVLAVARGAAVAGGALGVGLALALPTVIASLQVFYACLGVSLLVPVVAGLHSRRPGSSAALAAVAAGVATLGLATWRGGPGGIAPTTLALGVSAVAFAAAHLVVRPLMLRRGRRIG